MCVWLLFACFFFSPGDAVKVTTDKHTSTPRLAFFLSLSLILFLLWQFVCRQNTT